METKGNFLKDQKLIVFLTNGEMNYRDAVANGRHEEAALIMRTGCTHALLFSALNYAFSQCPRRIYGNTPVVHEPSLSAHIRGEYFALDYENVPIVTAHEFVFHMEHYISVRGRFYSYQ